MAHTRKVKLASGREVEIKRPGVLAKRTILSNLPEFLIGKKKAPSTEGLDRNQLLAFYDYQVATVRAFTGWSDEEIDGVEIEEFNELYSACESLEKEASDSVRPLSGTSNS